MLVLAFASLAFQVQDTLHSDIQPGPADSSPADFVRAPDFLFFTTQTPNPSIPVTDFAARTTTGTPGSFTSLPGFDRINLPFGAGGLIVYSSLSHFCCAAGLFGSDGSAAGTALIVIPGASEILPLSTPVEFAGSWYYGNNSFDKSTLLWRTRGTSATTEQLIVPISIPGSSGGFPATVAPSNQLVVGDRLFFLQSYLLPTKFIGSVGPTLSDAFVEFMAAGSGEDLQLTGTVGSRALFAVTRSDGSVELHGMLSGQVTSDLLGVLRPATVQGNANWAAGPVVAAGQLYVAVQSDGSQRLVVTDATGPGWTQLLDFTGYEALDSNAPISPSSAGAAAVLAGKAGRPAELWFSDGTTAGTTKSGALPFEFEDRRGEVAAPFADRRVLVSGLESDGNGRLWIATPGGISLLAEPGAAGELGIAYPAADTTTFDGDLYFAAWTQSAGRELHSLPLSLTGGSTAFRVFGGCAAAASAIPQISSTGGLNLGATAGFELSGAAANVSALWFFGNNDGDIGVFGECSVALGAPIFGTTLLTNASGNVAWNATIPSVSGLLGVPFRLQALVLDGSGAFGGVGSLSDALEITLAP